MITAEWQKLFTTYIETLHRINKFKSNKKLSVKMCACLSHAHRCPVHRSQRKVSENLRGGEVVMSCLYGYWGLKSYGRAANTLHC